MLPFNLYRVVAAIAAFVLLGWFGVHQYRARVAENAAYTVAVERLGTALRTSQEARKRDGAALALLRRENARIARETALAGQALDAAAAQAPEWAAESVPEEVQRALP